MLQMTTGRRTRIAALGAVAAILLLTPGPALAASVPEQEASAILRETGVEGGLVVHLGCGDGRLTAALRANERYLVHGLDADARNVERARAYIESLGLYGEVSVERWTSGRLPYAENLVNLLVAERLGKARMSEVMRVLAPGGVAYVRRGGSWSTTTKPWPEDMDEWTHFLHDASNNAVAADRRVGPPRRLQWTAGPRWSRSHEFISSVCAMVSAGGRIFYVVDEGLTSLTDAPLPDRWVLVARDAFNGVLLWKRPLPDWRADEWRGTGMRGRPASVPRRIVADRQYLYATLGHRAGLSVLDPATGETLRTIEGSENTQEIAQVGRTLLLRLAGVGVRRGEPRGFIAAVDADEGDIVWSVRADQFVGQSLAAANGRVVYDNSKEIVCLSLADGGELWREEGAGGRGERTLILHGDLVLEGGSPGVVARSAETGKTVWSARGGGPSMRPQDLFVAQGHAWHAAAGGIAGYDLTTGKATKIVDPSSVQSAGHHLRCHRAKATERFIITQFRGAEFVSLTDDEHCNNDWVRGACRYGVMPCNGLLYIPPNPCFCYPGVKLTGLLALAPAGDAPLRLRSGRRLERGEAYREAGALLAAGQGAADDWPTYRHDARRSGATGSGVPAQVATRWEVRVGGAVTPPVASGGRVYVAAKQEHTLHAYSVDGGRELWHFVAGGRIDSPPTLCGELVLLGCGDGYVYCLRASDGRMVWRFRAAPSTERVVARGRLESPWRVHGSVLLKDGIAYCTAGRSTFLDGGIWVLGLDPRTGRVVHEAHLDTWSRTREDAEGKPFIPSYHIEGAHSDILVSEGPYIYLGQYKLDLALAEQAAPYVMPGPDDRTTTMDISQEGFTVGDPAMDKGYEEIRDFHRYMESAHPELTKEYEEAYGGHNLGDRQSGLRLVATGGFLDDSWFNRTYWMYSSVWPGWYHAHRGAKTGQLLVVGDERTYAVQAFPTRNKQSPLFEPGAKGYLLLADSNDNEPLLDYRTRGATKGLGYTRMRPPEWYEWTPIRIRAMVLAGKHLFVAGPPDVVDADDPMASFEGRKGAKLRVVSADDGGKLAEYDLDIPPVFDGMIAASGRLFMCTTEGRLVCLGGA